MKLLKSLSIRNKLVLISVVPLLALIYFLQGIVSTELARKRATQEIYLEIAEVEKISNLIHELQKERGLTISFLQSNEEDDRSKMIEQWESTDLAVAELQKVYREHEKISPISAQVESLRAIREHLQELPHKINSIKSSLLGEISRTSRSSKNPEIRNMLEAHVFLLYTKDYLAQVRSILSGSIQSKEFRQMEYAEFSSLKGIFEINLQKFRESATTEVRNFFDNQIATSQVYESRVIIDSVFNDPGYLQTINFDFWWINSSIAVNLIKETEDLSLEKIKGRQELELASITRTVNTNLAVATAVILLIIILVVLMIRQIVSAVAKIKNAAERITTGDVDFTVDVTAGDEIGDLASSFNRMIDVTKEYSLVAETIGRGDYNVPVNVRSESDILGKALNNMQADLQKLSRDNETRTWFLTGNGELNDKMRGEKELINLAEEIITQLTSYLKAQIGAIYTRENGRLKLTGSYAFHNRKNNANIIALGEGLVGQSALEKKPILFNDIPDNYVKINSALGNAIPKNILVFPFLYEGEVRGVIEIGSVREFSDLDMQFLKMVGDNIGIAFNAAESRDRMKQLLEETQRQAEELEVQQEELKQTNEELQEKTDLLEKSEGELKAQQEELQQANEELEEKANLLEDQKQILESAKMQIENKARELEATSKYKSEFLANMSHELRTPLNSILILSQILKENKNKVLEEKEMQFAENIFNSGTDLLNLINEILDLAKVEAGKMELDVLDFPVNDLVEDIERMFTEVAESKSITFKINVNKDLSGQRLNTDKQRLEQVIRNLLSNAFKFTNKNGAVTLTVDYPADELFFNRIELQKRKDIIAVSVTDTGIGIPTDKLNVIFEAFQQVDGSTKRKYGGTGLGLSISRELAHTLGGEIHVESVEGKGSTFTFYFPSVFDFSLVREKVMIKEKTPRTTEYKTRIDTVLKEEGETNDDQNTIIENDRVVLIMEDDASFAKVLLDFVRDRNYKGIVAHQGNTGLSYARHYKPDAIILDMKLPILDGAEVLKQLKNDPELRHIPVQIISGFDRKREGMELGAFDFIHKPVRQEILWNAFDKIEDFVSRKIKRLLVVEDDKKHNESVKELIGNGDVKCFSAYSGKEAYEILQTDAFDCMIVDLGLPDMSGFDLLEKIKDNGELAKIPVIIYTGKDLTKAESNRLDKLASTVVLKTAHSHERLLDETMLFLHRVESKLPREKQNIIRKLHKSDEVLKNKKVLVVDDDIRNVYSLVNALEEEGLHCITAENGKEALKALKHNESIDIVLMDVMMPEMDGYDATKEIRKTDKFKKLPVIALTAKAMKGDREKCLAAGMSDYISKPLNVERLLSLMRVWLYT